MRRRQSGPPSARNRARGFTLIELLVAMAVLALLVVALGQLSGATSSSVSQGLRRADTSTRARAALDLVGQDISGGVFRPDLGAFPPDGTGSTPTFYTRRPGVGGDRSLSLIAYDFDSTGANLLRASQSVLWSDTAGIGFGSPGSVAGFASLTPADYQEIVHGVVRFAIYFIDASGQYQSQYDSQSRAVGIALAMADDRALQVLEETGKLGALQSRFSLQSSNPTSNYLRHWGDVIDNLPPADFPEPVRAGLRISERTIPLPTR